MEAKAGTPESPPKMPRSSFAQLLDSRKKRRKKNPGQKHKKASRLLKTNFLL